MSDTLPITVVIPSLPKRGRMLQEALDSVYAQTVPPSDVIVEVDLHKTGSAKCKDRATARVSTEWVAYLDDDDLWKPHHLEHLYRFATENEVDLAYCWYDVINGGDPHAVWARSMTEYQYGKSTGPVSNKLINMRVFDHIQWTTDINWEKIRERTEARRSGRRPGVASLDDHRFPRQAFDLGYRVMYLAEKNIIWRHHGGNTGGLPL